MKETFKELGKHLITSAVGLVLLFAVVLLTGEPEPDMPAWKEWAWTGGLAVIIYGAYKLLEYFFKIGWIESDPADEEV